MAAVIVGVVAGTTVLGAMEIVSFFQTTNKKVTCVTELSHGDHIKFKRSVYSHHAVVVCVYPAINSYKVIHFTGEKNSGIPPRIQEEVLNFGDASVILIMYRYGRLPRDVAVNRAYSLMTHQENISIVYDVLTNNCEHFATWCITGQAKSQQVNRALVPIAPYINIVGSIQRPY